jgi:uncharacterized protein YjbI with pentapeptide repeats
MANPEHVSILSKGVNSWNAWRTQNPEERADLRAADFTGTDLQNVDFSSAFPCQWWTEPGPGDPVHAISDFRRADLNGADLTGADLRGGLLVGANLCEANLTKANLSGANLSGAEMRGARLCGANLRGALLKGVDMRVQWSRSNIGGTYLMWTDLTDADLTGANLSGANLTRANLSRATLTDAILETAILVKTNLRGANLTGCWVYGVSAWGVRLDGAVQSNLIMTATNDVPITIDNLKMAQFLHLLLNNKEITDVIETVTSKVVLVLGRFTPERKVVLDAIRDELGRRSYTPVLFDFRKPANQTTMETVSALAHLARFAVVDLTDAKSVLQEMQGVAPIRPSMPIQPILISSQVEPGMFDFFHKFPWVLPTFMYESEHSLLDAIKARVIDPAERKSEELRNAQRLSMNA